jgi:hypothetical protein
MRRMGPNNYRTEMFYRDNGMRATISNEDQLAARRSSQVLLVHDAKAERRERHSVSMVEFVCAPDRKHPFSARAHIGHPTPHAQWPLALMQSAEGRLTLKLHPVQPQRMQEG